MPSELSLNIFVVFIVIIKIIFILSAIGYAITHFLHKNDKENARLLYVKERTEFVFIISMSILLIMHFKPGSQITPNKETGILFFIFGWILVVTAKWEIFFENSKILAALKQFHRSAN